MRPAVKVVLQNDGDVADVILLYISTAVHRIIPQRKVPSVIDVICKLVAEN